MTQGWDSVEPAPIEFFHARLLEKFHKWRRSKTESDGVEIDGTVLNNLIAAAKQETYAKYPRQNLTQPIPVSEM